MLNVPSTVNDPNYRYRMPKMNVKIESKGNGIKTNIVNLGDVAKYLNTNEEYILKFFGFEKASQTIFKEAGGKNNTNYIINGDFSYEDLLRLLDKYIEKYVCCPKCRLPEMHLIVQGDKLTGKCDSCPFVGELDNKHRLAAFIIKNPPAIRPPTKKEKEMHARSVVQKDAKIQQNQENEAFLAEEMEFGSEGLQRFIAQLKIQLVKQENQHFDIRSAKLVSKIKPIKLKKSITSFVVFNLFFTINIAKQIQKHAQLYLNMMKKLITEGSELETLLNIQYLFYESNKDLKLIRYLPTILSKTVEYKLISQDFLLTWAEEKIPSIETNFLFNPLRDNEFKHAVKEYIDYLKEEKEEEKDEMEQQNKQQVSA